MLNVHLAFLDYQCQNDGTILSELMGVFTKDDCYSDNFPVTSKMKYDFKYVKGKRQAKYT